MTCRPDKRLLGLLLLACALPALAGPTDDALAKARAAVAAEDGIAAEVAARDAMGRGAPRAAIAAYMGEAMLLQGKPGDALNWLEPGEFDAASAEEGFRALGRIKGERGEFGAAFAAYDRALEANPQSAATWVDIARLRYRSGEQHIVRAANSRALQIDPKYPSALALQAQLVRDADGLVASLPWFESAIAVAPDDVELLGDYAATLGEVGRYREMLDIVRRMTKIDAGYAQSYYLQAVLAARAGQNDLARKLLWRASDTIGATPAGLMLEGVLDFRSGRATLAVEKFDALVRQQPDNERAIVLLARALMASNAPAEAIDHLTPLAERATASPYVLTLLGRAYEQRGRRAEAAAWLDRAAQPSAEGVEIMTLDASDELALYRWQGDPDRPDAAVAELRSLVAGRDYSAASAFAGQVNERYRGSVDIATLIGDAALLAGQPGPAMTAYGEAAQVRRNTALALRMLWAMRAAGRVDAADELLAYSVAQNPQDPTLAAIAGRRAAAQGDWQLAAQFMRRAVDLGRNRDAQLLADLAGAEMKTGATASALDHARRAYVLQRWNPRVTQTFAKAMSGNGAQVLLAKARASTAATALALN